MSCSCTPVSPHTEETFVNAFPCTTVCSGGTPAGGGGQAGGTLTNVTISGGTMDNVRLSNCSVLTSTWTNGSILNASITGGTISSASLSSPAVTGGSLTSTTLLTCALTSPSISGATLSTSSWTGGTLVNPAMTGVAITSGDISGVAIDSCTITGLPAPTSPSDAATKSYVDSATSGLAPHEACRVASTANIAALSGLLTIDGVTLSASDRVLVKNQTSAVDNGIYVAAAGAWSRATDANGAGELDPGAYVSVTAGTTQGGTSWIVSGTAAITIGVDPINWVLFSSLGTSISGDKILPGTLLGDALADGTISIAAKFAQTLRPIEVVAALPASGNFLGRMVFLTTDRKLYRHLGTPTNATGFTAAVAAVDLTGTIGATQIADNAIQTRHLSAESVTTDVLNTELLTTHEAVVDVLTVGAIEAGVIKSGAIFADNIIYGEKIVAGAVIRSPVIGTGTLRFLSDAPNSSMLFATTTEDGADYSQIRLNGGGSDGRSRGGQIDLFGNEFSAQVGGNYYGGSVLITPGDGKSGGANQTGAVYIRDWSGVDRISVRTDQSVRIDAAVTVRGGPFVFQATNPGATTSFDHAVYSSGGFIYSSTRRLKDDIVPLSPLGALWAVQSLQGVRFRWNDGPKKDQTDFGFIAEEVQKVLPEAVHETDGKVVGVDYAKLTAVLVEAVKQLSDRVAQLEARCGK